MLLESWQFRKRHLILLLHLLSHAGSLGSFDHVEVIDDEVVGRGRACGGQIRQRLLLGRLQNPIKAFVP